jgi:hypothetical protein
VVDALGLPLTFEITEGQRHDSKPAKELVARVMSQCLLADKAYDSGDFRTIRTIISLPALWRAWSSSSRRKQTSSRAADSVADSRTVK